jgi:hypothetical protein
MQNEKVENQRSQVKRNSSRNNKNINQDRSNEKRLDTENIENRTSEADSSKHLRNEADLDRSGVSGSANLNDRRRGSGKTSKNAPNEKSNKQTQSSDFQNSGKTQDKSQTRSEESEDGLEKYNLTEQFDEDEDFGSNFEDDSRRQ